MRDWIAENVAHKQHGDELLALTAFRDGAIRSTWLDPKTGRLHTLTEPVAGDRFPSLSPTLPEVAWDEREIYDLFGFQPEQHPDPRPLIRTPRWPDGFFPLRGSTTPPRWIDTEPDLPARIVQGEGITVMKVGPTHAGIIESGHFVFSLIGENVLHLDAHLFQNHRGVEHLLEGKAVHDVAPVVARVCAADTVSHQVNWATAVEQLAGVELPAPLQRHRVLLLEAERVTSHLNDLAQIPAGVGFQVAHQRALAMKERWQRALQHLFHHRFLFDTVRPGWTRSAEPAAWLSAVRELRAAWRPWRRLVEEHHGFQDRMRGVGISPSTDVSRLGGSGVARRAVGDVFDARLLLPWYEEFHPTVMRQASGDVAARFSVRLDEVEESLRLVEAAASRPEAPGDALPHVALPGDLTGRAVTYTESPHGLNAHDITLVDGRVTRYHIRSGTYRNWPLLAKTVAGNGMADFPLINKSFELCYSCTDR